MMKSIIMIGKSLLLLTLITVFSFTECLHNGQFVRVSQFPYTASVRLNDKHLCGGVIIDDSTVLTAAHCVHRNFQKKSSFSVRLGATFHDEGQKFEVKKISAHKSFNKAVKNDFDIAVLKLSTKIIFDSNVQPIKLQKTKNISSGTKCYIAGWGDSIVALGLDALRVYIIENKECNADFSVTQNKRTQNIITQNMICARSSKCFPDRSGSMFNQEVLEGDTGGPLVCDHKLVGIVSFGCVECAQPHRPGVYTRISAVYDWIYEKSSGWPHCSRRNVFNN